MDQEQYLKAIEFLNKHTKLYDEGKPIISDKEWDDLYFQVVEYEKTNKPDINSPTQKIKYQTSNSLRKVTHKYRMLSLSKTKDIEAIKNFSDKDLVAMLKMDGLTCSLTYQNGKLVRAETRGNGLVGEDITHNALVIHSIPKEISNKEETIINGEIICRYNDFEEFSDRFKNPRNFASGSIRLLDSNECAKRKLTFIAWDIVQGTNTKYFDETLNQLQDFGFIVVPYEISNVFDYEKLVNKAKELFYPIDGLVYRILDNKYWKELGSTEYSPNGSIAFKLYDELYETELINITWSVGRTGTVTPVAKFKPVIIDGTVVQNASLHNLTILEETLGKPYVGQKILVFKANQIIPQIYSAEKGETN